MNTNTKKTKGFFFQILVELKVLLSSKFNIIVAAIIILGSIAVPVVGKIQSEKDTGPYYGNRDMEDIEIDGQIISVNNPQYWEVRNYTEEIKYMTEKASVKADDLTIEYLNMLLDNAVLIAAHVDSYEDYRSDLSWERQQIVTDKFIFEHLDLPKEDLIAAIQYRMYMELTEMDEKYYSLSQLEVLEKISELEEQIAIIDDIIVNNDHIAYYDYQINNRKQSIEENLDKITTLEQDIIESPSNEEMYSDQIEQLERTNSMYTTIDIPNLEYRAEHNIVPRSGEWKDNAMQAKQNAQYNLIYNELMSEADFESNDYLKREYKTYAAYKKNWQKEQDQQTENLYVAEQSLASEKPDMDFVTDGSRKKKVSFLWYSLVIALFGAVIGGGLMAREYQSGTIRLLLIRPKTRVKIVLSKFLALLALCIGLYIVVDVINALMTGFLFGFGDYSFPNYSISSGAKGINFFGFYIGNFLTCCISVLFACCTAYFFSMVTRNTAISVAAPLIVFVASLFLMQAAHNTPSMKWLAYTPIAYVDFSTFFISNMTYWSFEPMMGLGIAMMLVFSLLLLAAGVFVSEKRDITN
jgi:ABC-2 type transport system permease protein